MRRSRRREGGLGLYDSVPLAVQRKETVSGSGRIWGEKLSLVRRYYSTNPNVAGNELVDWAEAMR